MKFHSLAITVAVFLLMLPVATPSFSNEPSISETLKSISGKWKVETVHLHGLFNGQPVFDHEESGDDDQITFHKNGTFETLHDGEVGSGKFKLLSGTKIEIIDHDAFVKDELGDEKIPRKYNLKVDENNLTLYITSTFTEDDMEMQMTVTVKASR